MGHGRKDVLAWRFIFSFGVCETTSVRSATPANMLELFISWKSLRAYLYASHRLLSKLYTPQAHERLPEDRRFHPERLCSVILSYQDGRGSAVDSPRISSTGAFKSSLDEIWVLHTRSTSILRESIRFVKFVEEVPMITARRTLYRCQEKMSYLHRRYWNLPCKLPCMHTGHDDRAGERNQSMS
jgi:hypothetical protein